MEKGFFSEGGTKDASVFSVSSFFFFEHFKIS